MTKEENKIHVNIIKADWIIHYVFDASDIDGIANIHTHGLENYNHLNFQIVLGVGTEIAKYVLNTFGNLVQEGRVFHDGDVVPDIFEDCDVKLKKYHETDREVLRIIIPDMDNRFPGEDGCEYPYSYQEDPSLDNM